MIVTPQEYNSMLHQLADPNDRFFDETAQEVYRRAYIRIPADEKIYNINLNTREVEAPKTVGVATDGNAEIIWFKFDRYHDDLDLYNGACWVQYINANKQKFFWYAPMQIKGEEHGKDSILIPWVISANVAAAAGTIEFNFQFFGTYTKENNETKFSYILNTSPAKTQVLKSLPDVNDRDDAVQQFALSELQKLEAKIDAMDKDFYLYWIEV